MIMTALDQKVAIFAPQHIALTRKLDTLELGMSELANLEAAHELLGRSVTAAEQRILQGREQLKRDWRTHSASTKGKASNRVDQEAKTFQDTLARWDAEEVDLHRSKTQKLDTTRKLYECRERPRRYARALAHLDAMYSVIFEGVKIEDPEWSFFEWQIQCAKADLNLVCSQLETSLASLNAVNAVYSTLMQINRHYTMIEEIAVQYPQCWKEIQKMSESKDFWGSSAAFLPALHRDHIIVITGALGFVEVNLRQKALDHLGKLKEHGANVNTSIEALSLVFYPCKIQGNTVTTVEGKETPLFLPRKYSHPEDEAPMEFATAATTIRDALQVLEIERDVTQQRIDELAGEATQVRSVLETETERRRSYRRACFEEIIARNASSRTQSRADVDPSRSSGSSTISSPIVLEASMSTLAFSEPTVPAASDIASADHPPAYSHGS